MASVRSLVKPRSAAYMNPTGSHGRKVQEAPKPQYIIPFNFPANFALALITAALFSAFSFL